MLDAADHFSELHTLKLSSKLAERDEEFHFFKQKKFLPDAWQTCNLFTN